MENLWGVGSKQCVACAMTSLVFSLQQNDTVDWYIAKLQVIDLILPFISELDLADGTEHLRHAEVPINADVKV